MINKIFILMMNYKTTLILIIKKRCSTSTFLFNQNQSIILKSIKKFENYFLNFFNIFNISTIMLK